MIYILCFILLLLALLGYFRLADKYNIIDKPNERSSHSYITIRGGGIVFLLAILMTAILQPYYWLPGLGAMIIGTISFLDDRIDLSGKIRLPVHLIAVSILFIALGFFAHPEPYFFWLLPLLYVIVIGIINAYNFMDGINGITGLYSLVILGGLQFVNLQQLPFVEPDLIWLPMMACAIFLYFNLRKKARCFAGDVGSITIAYWIVFLILKLINQTGDLSYILFLSLYGVDAILTILHRLYLRQNIFRAHRLHFYQVLVNQKGRPHVGVSLAYALLQTLVITFILFSGYGFWTLAALSILPFVLLYTLKFRWLRSRAGSVSC